MTDVTASGEKERRGDPSRDSEGNQQPKGRAKDSTIERLGHSRQ